MPLVSLPRGTFTQNPGLPLLRSGLPRVPVILLGCLGLFLVLLGACSPSKPLYLGFLGTLSGRFSDLSESGHNGAILAIEEANRSGGVQGRDIELIEEDDRADGEVAVAAFEKLLSRGAVAVVGPMISKTALAVVPSANQHGVVVMGPTISTNQLTGIDDWFFRVYTPSEVTSRQLARLIWSLGARRVMGVYDLTNRAHTEGAYVPFRDEFLKQGGTVLPALTFSASEQASFTQLARQIAAEGADSVFAIMGTLDTALLSQCLAKAGSKPLLCCTDWSGTGELAKFGGQSIDGLVFLHSMNKQANAGFRQAYLKRFTTAPDFAALRSYEATWILLQALRKNPDSRALRSTLLSTARFQVAEELIEFDRFGDVQRSHFPYRLVAGEMQPLKAPP